MWNWEKIKKKYMYIFWRVPPCVWIIGVIILLRKYDKPDSLNEWGDFLAGIFSPVALIMLVLGYRQQKEELKSNTEQLKNQAEQLTKQTEILAAQHKMQEEMHRDQKGPDLYFEIELRGEKRILKITNKGAMAIDITTSLGLIPVINFGEIDFLDITNVMKSDLRIRFDSKKFDVSYVDFQDKFYSIEVSVDNGACEKKYKKIKPYSH